jgi:hypothetical protein
LRADGSGECAKFNGNGARRCEEAPIWQMPDRGFTLDQDACLRPVRYWSLVPATAAVSTPSTATAAAATDMSAAAAAAANYDTSATAAGTMPAKAAAQAISALIKARAIPAVDVEAERHRLNDVDLIGNIRGQAHRHGRGAGRCQRAGSDDRCSDACRDEEFPNHVSSLFIQL